MEPVQTLTGMILSGVVIAGSILLPVLLVIFVIQLIRNSVTPQQKEMKRLLAEAVELLRENNRLLRERSGESSAQNLPDKGSMT